MELRKEATHVTTNPNADEAPLDAKKKPRKSLARFVPKAGSFKPRFNRRTGKTIVSVVLLGLFLNYGVVGNLLHDIDADPDFRATFPPSEGSAAVTAAAALLNRELNTKSWVPNDQWFAPTALFDNMPNFQIGLMNAVGRFSFEMLDQIGRRSGSSAADPDLERAAGFLQYPPDIWIWEPSNSFLPSVASETQYQQGLEAFLRYNARLTNQQAVFERRSDTLAQVLSRISDNLGSRTSQLEAAQSTGWWLFSQTADDVFFQNKGTLYGYDIILEGLGEDFALVIAENNLTTVWEQILASLRQGSQLRPSVVLNASIERSIFANHLALQGFFMKRAILQLEEVIGVLEV